LDVTGGVEGLSAGGGYRPTMPPNARGTLASLLRDLRSGGSFCTRRTAPVDDLAIEIRGVGPLGLPVTAAQAKQLRFIARPATYGLREHTVLDRQVRDTWEIPRSRVRIDKRRWDRTLHPMLDRIRQDLGLPATSSLEAELHSMLVYEPRQFFASHQDSEKDDRMIGTLVVMLPSNSRGGDLLVEHRGRSQRHRGSAKTLTFVAFFSDTRHEVLPVDQGYRVVLTYNLMIGGDSTPEPRDDTPLTGTAAQLLERHFAEHPEPRWPGDREARKPPDRLVFLLDHQYTERGLRWSHLKGDDAIRADVLRRGAEAAECEAALAHAEVEETWEAGPAPRRRWERWDWDNDPDNDPDDDGDGLELGDLLDSTIRIVPAAGEAARFDREVTDAELAAVTPSVELAPYETEYTGYMGNWGNTMDRWYRRAAIVIWPRARAFAVRAKGDPLGALHDLLDTATDVSAAAQTRADNVATLLRFWPDRVHGGADQRTLLPPALRLARELGDEGLATRLLEPFSLEAIMPEDATVLLALTEQHGRRWLDSQITSWLDQRPPSRRRHRRVQRGWSPSPISVPACATTGTPLRVWGPTSPEPSWSGRGPGSGPRSPA
jgi:hypothetical protein